ncbi:ArsR/SmtB family transcription factor [Sphingomonas montana]|uniref:ArsR/SmtB family transcription factor n=1 Tax=Sphingomonas montana TaxID=1843236 RepID=UPI00096DBE72|nr:metalloregulator ArsR/SmtB family transcription factor [Sphingomonas montana]
MADSGSLDLDLDLDAAADLLRALAHGTRLALLRVLIHGERSVGEIEQATGVGQPGLSQQLGVLRKADLVHTRKDAKLVIYRLNRDRLAEMRVLFAGFAGTPVPRDQAIVARMRDGGGAAMFARVSPRN